MKDRLKKIILSRRIIISLYILFAITASILSLNGEKSFTDGGKIYNKYNNYTIFKQSFYHLKSNQDLYLLYPEEHWDLYKYTPTFSVFFGGFAMLPDWLGLSLWNILNALVLLFAILYLPKLSKYQKGWILFIVLIELMVSMQNEQSNALLAGLLVLSFGLLERGKFFWAAFCIVFTIFIKLFGVVGFALFLFYPQKWKSILAALFWTGILLLPPFLFIDSEQYITLFSSYLNLLTHDHTTSYGFSVMGWIHSWFSVEINKKLIVGIGCLIFLLPMYKIKLYNNFLFKNLMLSSILIWIVIFNHKAESPTFIIAMTGIALWFVLSQKSILNSLFFASAFILTTLSSTDIFPSYLRENFVKPYILKALPCIVIWLKIVYDMLNCKNDNYAII